jgi:hypothetical protein
MANSNPRTATGTMRFGDPNSFATLDPLVLPATLT